MSRAWRNWSRNVVATPAEVAAPRSLGQLAAVLDDAARRGLEVKAVGSGHSFGPIAATAGVQVSLRHLDRLVEIDAGERTVTAEAGMRLSTLIERLAEAGWALANLGDISYQTLAGAIATGTHGSGIGNGPLSAQVARLRLMAADGRVLECSREQNEQVFLAALTGLGALGIVVEVSFRIVPAFMLRQRCEAVAIEELAGTVERGLAAGTHLDFMLDFDSGQVVVRTTEPAPAGARPRSRARSFFDDVVVGNLGHGLACASGRRHPQRVAGRIGRLPASSRLDFVDRSDRVFTAPRRWPLVAAEYAVPVPRAIELVSRVGERAREAGVVAGFPLFVRYVAADDSFLGMSSGRDSAFICPIALRPLPFRRYFELAEEVLKPEGARPHWGKWHGYGAAELAPLYPRWEDFQRVRAELDPAGLFENAHLRRVLGPVAAGAERRGAEPGGLEPGGAEPAA